MEPLTVGGTILGVGKAIGLGACLAVGFWAAKKLTDRIDYFIAQHSVEFKELVSSLAAAEENKQSKEEPLDQSIPTPATI